MNLAGEAGWSCIARKEKGLIMEKKVPPQKSAEKQN